MTRTLIFEINAGEGGHHIEYLHHIYLGAEITNNYLVFVVPEEFKKTSERFDWPERKNVSFQYISTAEINSVTTKKGFQKIYHLCKMLRYYTLKHSIDSVFLISLANYLLFIPLLLPKRVKVSGIIYNIYLYSWHKLSIKKKVEQMLIHIVLTKCKIFERIYILNDRSAVAYFNKLYVSEKYFYLPDPIIQLPTKRIDTRKMLGIPEDGIFFLQCGNQNIRKNPLKILKTISELSPKENFYYVIAGKLHPLIKDEIVRNANILGKVHNIIIRDEHLSYDMMNSLIEDSDCMFLLYENNTQSSGFMGYAALHGTPVIAYKNGLIGKIVKRYHLGKLVEPNNCNDIKNAICSIEQKGVSKNNSYSVNHTVGDFIDKIFISK